MLLIEINVLYDAAGLCECESRTAGAGASFDARGCCRYSRYLAVLVLKANLHQNLISVWHTVLPAVTFMHFPQLKLVLDLATPEGCKAELTWVIVVSQDTLLAKDGHLSQNDNLAVSRPKMVPETESRMFSVLHRRAN